MRRIVVLFMVLGLAGCAAGPVGNPYGAPPETSDPWALIEAARGWLAQGRPRGALPSLQKAEAEVAALDPAAPGSAHLSAAIQNEYGRVYEMASDLARAEAAFRRAEAAAAAVPDYRPLHFDIAYNLSTVYERQGKLAASCASLQQANDLAADLAARPAPPPKGYGPEGAAFIAETVRPRIAARAARIDCPL